MNTSKLEDRGKLDFAQTSQYNGVSSNLNDTIKRDASLENGIEENQTQTQRRLLEEIDNQGAHDGHSKDHNIGDGVQGATVENDQELEEEADSSFDLFRDTDEYYDNPEHSAELGDLDLSVDSGNFRAYVYSSPTVVDLDGDGKLDILVGTSYGLFYILDHHGQVRNKFSLEMVEIQAPAVAADINDDGKIEIVTVDTHGNVAAWTAQGEEIWEVHLKSLIPQI
ncbi:hypothetical protein ZIOFF_054053 [Zingiber officinale]|uniref:Uncharacterized protein n=1 Tax=Zingiber officinale TaxID=94328 RepID=A0A8J5KDC1_ZINOF|nr:hypothetical protein ZIOFF_054053 [Zingiber officinale]